MNIVIDVGGKIVVDNMGDVGNIETSGGNCSGDQNRATTSTEHLKSTLTLGLSAVSVDRSGGEVLVKQEIAQRIGHALSLNKNEGETPAMGVKDVQKYRAFVLVLHILDFLGNIFRGGTNTPNGQKNVILQKVSCEHLYIPGEGG